MDFSVTFLGGHIDQQMHGKIDDMVILNSKLLVGVHCDSATKLAKILEGGFLIWGKESITKQTFQVEGF